MQTNYVASGDYSIATSESKRLKALLGSCVGVALYDKTTDVGGLIHLLLPEPATPTSSWAPCSYASTGLPLFINTLVHFGAKREQLEAVVAGGALFGEVSRHDIALNIGGRCVEKVHDVLRLQQIPIVQEESCGFSPYSLILDTHHWQVAIENRFPQPPLAGLTPPPNREQLVAAVAAITPIPQAALEIIHQISSNDYQTAELARTVETDQVLAAQILRLCNSPACGVKRPIASIEEAVLLLGSRHLLEMVATASVDSLLAGHQGGYAMLKGGLYKHALGVARAARQIAISGGRINPGLAYAAGLMHDIGKVVLDQYFASFNPLFYRSSDTGKGDFIDLEQQALKTDHQQVGRLLAVEWGLPEPIAQAITHHHHPEQATADAELVHLIYLADLLTSWYLSGMEFERINTGALQARLSFLGLKPGQLPELIEQVPWQSLMYL